MNFMRNSGFNMLMKNICVCYDFLRRHCSKYLLEILIVFLLLSFLFSSYMIFCNYDNLFFRKVFYFHSEHELISDLRYLKKRKTLKENLDLLVKDFLLGNSKGFYLQFGTTNVKLLYSFMSNDVYFINLSKEFYDSFGNGAYKDSEELRVSLFVKSLKETINFNYPRDVKEIFIFIEGYILNV
ncbi:Flagellar filament outsheath protein [Borrelia crocidurae DOU]|uniref:Flagellar filament outsheath protein n=2 Tax=Borrelia crocidurae TaxID=29520 RepID=W5SII8_9SPIR|nr:Flagellar filament outsheath protein [Borrelia crocidurae DOU]